MTRHGFPAILATTGMAVMLAAGPSARQQPDTEVFLAALSSTRTPAVYGPVLNISRNDGYDNQPGFTPDGRAVLFASNRDGQQTDIYRYDIAARELQQITDTPEAEYSPTVAPDAASFSVVRVEADGRQRLWRFNLDGTNPRLVMEQVDAVGYHAWIDPTHLALFLVGGNGAPNSLRLAETTTESTELIEERIGRSIHVRPGHGTVSYISQPAGGRWMVKEVDPSTREVRVLGTTADENQSQDMAWDPATGRLLMARGAQIWGWLPDAGGWRLLGSLSGFGVRNITRLAVRPGSDADPGARLAVVGEVDGGR